jgi:Tfp pilus assembly protein PilF
MRADFDAPRPTLVQSLLGVSAHRERRGDLQGALRAAEQARAEAPSSGAAALREAVLRAAVARRAEDADGLQEARTDIERLVSEQPEAAEPRLAAARLALDDGRREEAAQAARALAAERPEWAPPRTLLARALLTLDPREALVQAEQAGPLAPSDPDALAARAAAYAAHALDRAAEVDARRALRLRPDPELTAVLARVQLRSGKPRAAIASGEAVLEAERSAELELVLVRAHWELGAKDAAFAALERAKLRAGDAAGPQNEVLDLALVIALSEGRTGAALADLEAAQRARPEDPRLAELIALGEMAEGRLPSAEANARRAVLLAPQRPTAWYLLAEILERQGARPPARERARAALGAEPTDARADLLAGLLAERAGQTGPAQEAYEAALARDPQLAVASLRLARLLALEERDVVRATTLAEGALGEVGWSFESARVLGRTLLASGRAGEAVSAYQVALGTLPQLDGEAEPVQLSLALALARDGRKSEAKTLVSALVDAGSRRDPAPPWLAQAKELRQQLAAPPEEPASAP